MTAPTTHDRETLTRASLLFNKDTDLHWDDAIAQAAAHLEAERADEAARQATAKEMTDSLNSMWSCPVCGQTAMDNALCTDCRRIAVDIELQRSQAKTLPGGGDRRAAVQEWMTKVGR